MKIGFESKKGETGVLLLHGLSGTPSEVQPLGEYLSNKGFFTLGPWLKGHYTSPRDLAKTRWQDWAQSARESYDQLRQRCPKVFVAGLSMGADLALHLAATVPVEGVISLSAPVRIFDFRFNGIAFFRYLQWWTTSLTGGVLDPKASPHVTYPYVMTKSLHDLKKLMEVVLKELPQITAPTLVVQGRKDSMVPPQNGDLIYQALHSQSKHHLLLDRSDHVVTLDYDKEILFEKAFQFIQSGGARVD